MIYFRNEEEEEIDTPEDEESSLDDALLDEVSSDADTEADVVEGFGHISDDIDKEEEEKEDEEEDVTELEEDAEDVDYDTFDDIDEM